MGAGFQLNRSQSSGEFAGVTEVFDIAATHTTRLAVGDVVTISGTSTVTPVGSQMAGRSQIDAADPNDAPPIAEITGIISSFTPNLAEESLNDAGGLAALTAGSAQVVIDNNTLFEVESATTLVANNVGLNATFVATEATQTGGLTISNMTLTGTGAVAEVDFPFRIFKLLEGKTSGVLGDRALVRMNNTTAKPGALGV